MVLILESRRRRRKYTRTLVLCALVVAGLFFWGWTKAQPWLSARYHRWKQTRALGQAREFIEKKDPANALLSLQVALQADPGNPVAWRMAADFLEQGGNWQAVKLREQVIRAEPAVLENRLALARTALRFHDVAAAEQALREIPAAARETVDYKKVAAAIALAGGRAEMAEALLSGVLRDEPNNVQARLGQLSLQLRFGDRARSLVARNEFERLALKRDCAPEVLRELAADALRRNDVLAAFDYTRTLCGRADATFADRIGFANTRVLARRESVDEVAESLKTFATASPAEAAQFAGWLIAHGQATKANRWLETLPAGIRDAAPTLVARADCFVSLKAWARAAELIERGVWGPIPPDLVRLAMSVRFLQDRERTEPARQLWEETVRLGAGDLNALRVLYRLALAWNGEQEAQTVLFAIVRNHPQQTWACQTLVNQFYQKKDAVKLKAAYTLWHEIEPGNRRVEGDRLMLVLLTQPRPTSEVVKALEKLHLAEPDNAFFATARAFAQWQQGRVDEALAIMEKIKPADRRLPGRAFYCALFLASAGKTDEAQTYLPLSDKADLLPEEKEVVRVARAKIKAAEAAR